MAEAPIPGAGKRAELEQANVSIRMDGEEFTMRMSDLTARDSAALRQATGMSLRYLLTAVGKDPDLDAVAAVVWMARRQRGDDVTFDEVANEIGYETKFETVDAPTEDQDSPGV
jgi:hypothetical protein